MPDARTDANFYLKTEGRSGSSLNIAGFWDQCATAECNVVATVTLGNEWILYRNNVAQSSRADLLGPGGSPMREARHAEHGLGQQVAFFYQRTSCRVSHSSGRWIRNHRLSRGGF